MRSSDDIPEPGTVVQLFTAPGTRYPLRAEDMKVYLDVYAEGGEMLLVLERSIVKQAVHVMNASEIGRAHV